jgi:hypothetical protein
MKPVTMMPTQHYLQAQDGKHKVSRCKVCCEINIQHNIYLSSHDRNTQVDETCDNDVNTTLSPGTGRETQSKQMESVL